MSVPVALSILSGISVCFIGILTGSLPVILSFLFLQDFSHCIFFSHSIITRFLPNYNFTRKIILLCHCCFFVILFA